MIGVAIGGGPLNYMEFDSPVPWVCTKAEAGWHVYHWVRNSPLVADCIGDGQFVYDGVESDHP